MLQHHGTVSERCLCELTNPKEILYSELDSFTPRGLTENTRLRVRTLSQGPLLAVQPYAGPFTSHFSVASQF